MKPESKEVQHIHPLTVVTVGDFICNGCNTEGYGKTYCCANCDYHLHEYCATCPTTLLSFMHPQHELGLVFEGPERLCNICDESVEGLYYRCIACDFDVHPLCTRLPQHVRHVPHPAHPLELSHSEANSTCMVCRGAIQSWRYKCGPCGLDVHMECVNSSASAATGTHNNPKHGCGCEHNNGDTNQGQDQVPRPYHVKRRRMLRILKFITVEVIRNIIAP
ncbi:unnamed protein product [Arabidopsis lyrata]|uniref:uncharacterized protein LOC110226548 n=1 Tax=Arabidopsis lyrata subsp. lyrata TaxID=81972 RepID=UPI000A29C0B3|nr:uncharacterized protein LOC110226548 [Arabidopsis lyrata subsp. lyrata]XP_020882730.1 uncharacterized protein LOC110228860 [Arabidopsis lyrata subsp. lyrata]CAH8265098.1 unnamed protein product [Arabidopsis lyrata]|eukprot:XP_020874149.1 uncharacterized protein LOC110226548 [Arabidopsis lyrata subsp. lyrata]